MLTPGPSCPTTYAYLPVINEFLRSHGFPEVTVVTKNSKYAGLYENCLGNETLPSLAFGKKGCSLKWKVDPMNAWMNKWAPAKGCWKAGFKVIKAIGYDGGARDKQRFCQSAESEAKRAAAGKGDKKYTYWYPLIEWGIDREACVATIEACRPQGSHQKRLFLLPSQKTSGDPRVEGRAPPALPVGCQA